MTTTLIAYNEVSTLSRLREMVTNKTDLLRVSDRLNVYPSTVQKILEGRPVSPAVRKKITHALQEDGIFELYDAESPSIQVRDSTQRRLLEVYHLYEKKKSLRAVGRKIGLSQEGIRLLLKRGTEIGLFTYQPPKKSRFVPRSKILKDYQKFLKLSEVAKNNGISAQYLSKLLAVYRIAEEELNAVKREGQRIRLLAQYRAIVEKLGHHPTTTELRHIRSAQALTHNIRKLWGSFDAFRKEQNISINGSRRRSTQEAPASRQSPL
ncbi:MAG TPA: hypothetical protein VI382_07450 [Candidatus Manganitrophaceae bacterium]|nr:hypothetical protein [Candidatus Manganitrophaceae bacterium]